MAREDIRAARCPLCGGAAALRLSANGLTYLAMDCCKAQLFARGGDSDELLRALPDAAVKAPPAEPAPAPTPKPPEPAAKPPVPTPTTPKAPEPTPPKRSMGWGLFPNA